MLEDLLLPGPLQSIPDVVAIGTQETDGNREEWEIGLQETLGPGHVLFHSVELGTLHLAVFLRRDLIWVCSGNIRTRSVKQNVQLKLLLNEQCPKQIVIVRGQPALSGRKEAWRLGSASSVRHSFS